MIAHCAVLEAAVVGKEDRDGLTKPRAFIVLKAHVADHAALSDELKDHVKQRIGVWKYPRWIRVLSTTSAEDGNEGSRSAPIPVARRMTPACLTSHPQPEQFATPWPLLTRPPGAACACEVGRVTLDQDAEWMSSPVSRGPS